MCKATRFAISFLAASLLAPTTQAADGFALEQFQPAPAGDRFFGVQGGDPGGHLLPRLMLLGDYAYRPLVLYREPGGEEIGDLVSHHWVLHLSAGIALWDRLSLFADMPLALYIDGGDPSAGGQTVLSPSGAAAGDLRLGARVRLAGEASSAATLSLSAYLFLPTGDDAKLAGDGEVHGQPALVFAGETDDVAYGLTAGLDISPKRDYGGASLGSRMVFGGGLALLFSDRTIQLGPEFYGSTVFVGDSAFDRETTNLEALLGFKARIESIVLGAAMGPGITQGMGTPSLRAILSLAYAPLPEEPLPPPPPPPPPPPDQDGDGIIDRLDACPLEPGVRSSDPAKNGCPIVLDRDGDGISDKDDACPVTKGVPSVDPALNGCPPDTDGDGITDDMDACPYEKGLPNSDPQKRGCPELVRVTEEEIVILEQVQFKTGSAVIQKVSDDLLQQVSTVLGEHPEIRRIEIQGHTDNRGGRAYNQRLSQRRASAVMKWLTKRGNVDPTRLLSKGYGMEEPIAPNDTPEDRQKNRRVQFKIIEKSIREKGMVSP